MEVWTVHCGRQSSGTSANCRGRGAIESLNEASEGHQGQQAATHVLDCK